MQKKQAMSLPENVFEYLLIANPSPEIFALIKREKEFFTQIYNHAITAKTEPHITVANFLAVEGMELTICRWFQNLFSQQSGFRVELDGFGGFPSHTIYLRIKNEMPFQQLANQLKPVADVFKNQGLPPFKLINNRHLTIARGLTEDVYTQAVGEYATKIFHESFMLDELLLLRRKHRFDNCSKIQIFRLKPQDHVVM